MKKVNLLSKDEMRNVMGGVIDGATLEELCKNGLAVGHMMVLMRI